MKEQPEYVFALNRDYPRLGLFVPFYIHFLEQWDASRHPCFDFDTRELVYSDEKGREVRRTRLSESAENEPAFPQAPHRPSIEARVA